MARSACRNRPADQFGVPSWAARSSRSRGLVTKCGGVLVCSRAMVRAAGERRVESGSAAILGNLALRSNGYRCRTGSTRSTASNLGGQARRVEPGHAAFALKKIITGHAELLSLGIEGNFLGDAACDGPGGRGCPLDVFRAGRQTRSSTRQWRAAVASLRPSAPKASALTGPAFTEQYPGSARARNQVPDQNFAAAIGDGTYRGSRELLAIGTEHQAAKRGRSPLR